ncbi:hypothetical protein ScalyP_jg1511 [Parmales sp. scaly parma]|nr:hypothetical protein ScalyP_jg1511 [Parmales sp. scaly parma]
MHWTESMSGVSYNVYVTPFQQACDALNASAEPTPAPTAAPTAATTAEDVGGEVECKKDEDCPEPARCMKDRVDPTNLRRKLFGTMQEASGVCV